jgi:hypothetical protein
MHPVISTSYFAKESLVANPVRISRAKPAFSRVPAYLKLAPPWELVRAIKDGLIDERRYVEIYRVQVLDLLDPASVVREIGEAFGPEATLLCYERPGVFCHRRLVADWIEIGTGIAVPELEFPGAKAAVTAEPPAAVQLKLF